MKKFSVNIFFGSIFSVISHVHISEIKISAAKKALLKKLWNILKMNLSDKEVQVESLSVFS